MFDRILPLILAATFTGDFEPVRIGICSVDPPAPGGGGGGGPTPPAPTPPAPTPPTPPTPPATFTQEQVDELTGDGFAAVYNTPNDQSRPGYLKMGWHQLGRPRIVVLPGTPATVVRMLRARQPAAKWSVPVDVGEPADGIGERARPPAGGAIRRDEVPGYTAWRYGFEPLHYRAVEVRGGLAVFRVRERGPLREVAVVEWRSRRRDPLAIRRVPDGRALRGAGKVPQRSATRARGTPAGRLRRARPALPRRCSGGSRRCLRRSRTRSRPRR